MRLLAHAALLGLTAVLSACAGRVEVTRVLSPSAAAQAQNQDLRPTAIVRGSSRIPIPPGAQVQADRVVLPHGQDPAPAAQQTGSASSPAAATSAPGTREQAVEAPGTIPLLRSDSIEMHGQFASDERVPGGGHIESTRSTAALVGGIVLLSLSYVPTAYVGARSTREADGVLEVPIAGPWVDLARRPACTAPPSPIPLPVDPCIVETVSRAALVTSGVVQGIGALLTVVGLPTRAHLVEGGDVGVTFLPMPGGGTAIGRF